MLVWLTNAVISMFCSSTASVKTIEKTNFIRMYSTAAIALFIIHRFIHIIHSIIFTKHLFCEYLKRTPHTLELLLLTKYRGR